MEVGNRKQYPISNRKRAAIDWIGLYQLIQLINLQTDRANIRNSLNYEAFG